MKTGIIYFNVGRKCVARLLVSLYSLRKHYDGPITLISSGDESNDCLGALLTRQNPFGVDLLVAEFPDIPLGRHEVYLQKAAINSVTPYDLSIFLDADTLVRGDVTCLWDLARRHEFVVPQFADWTSRTRTIARRIANWKPIYPNLIEPALEFGPAVNCGVFAFNKDGRFVQDWASRILPGRDMFIPDETGMQLLLHEYPHYVADQKFNVSCRHSDPRHPDTRVIHYHGRRHCRMDRQGKPLGNADLWLAEFDELRTAHGDVLDGKVTHFDRTLRRYLRGQGSRSLKPAEPASRRMTLVTAVNAPYLEKLKLTLPTWQRKPQLADCPLIVFYNGLSTEQLEFVREQRRDARLIPWDLPKYDSYRELMLSAFVVGVADAVETPYWVKIDADAFLLNDSPVFLDHMFDYDIAGHKWRYTKPGRWLAELDDWAATAAVDGERYLTAESRPQALAAGSFGHRRIASWLCLHRTDFSSEAVNYLDGRRLPVPSHDTFMWYLAERLPHRRWCWHNFKRMGASNHTRIQVIRERVGETASSTRL